MKQEKKKTAKSTPKSPKKAPALRKKVIAVEPKEAASPAPKKKAAERKSPSETMKAAVNFMKSAAIRATRKIKEAIEEPSHPRAPKADKSESAADKTETSGTKTLATPVPAPVPLAKPTRAPRKAPAEIPSILLEGDAPSAPTPSGPGKRYSLGPKAPSQGASVEASLPESYGTKKLLLTARDPHWLYAHWDFTQDDIRQYNAKSAKGHLVLRVYQDKIAGDPHVTVNVHPESRNWFVYVGDGGSRYLAELGYADASGEWNRICISGATVTPPDTLSDDTSVRFATIPVDVPFEDLIQMVKTAVSENVPLAEAIMQLRGKSGSSRLPKPGDFASAKWTPTQERALGEMITMDSVRRVWIGSLEITELIRRQLDSDMSSMAAAQFSLPSSMSVSSLSSPFGGSDKKKGFWFNINAELIIYGATESDADVEIGGRTVKLRPDGTFSFRFILPDGNFDLPAQATSADGDDTRKAHLKFSRSTNYAGEVGAHPQDPAMKRPEPSSIS